MNEEHQQISKRTLSFMLYGGQQQYDAFITVRDWYKGQPEQFNPEFHQMNLKEKAAFHERQIMASINFMRQQGTLRNSLDKLLYLSEIIGMEAGRFWLIQKIIERIGSSIKLEKSQQFFEELNSLKKFGCLLLDEYDLGNKRVVKYHDQNDLINTYVLTKEGTHRIYSKQNILKSGMYYSGQISSVAFVLCMKEQQICLAVVNLQEGNKPNENVHINWMGKSLQLINNWCIGFDGAIIQELIPLNDSQLQKLQECEGFLLLDSLHNALRDLLKGIEIQIKYCQMRKQFETLDVEKQERTIFDYQIVLDRLLTAMNFGISYSIALKNLLQDYEVDFVEGKERSYQNLIFAKQFTLSTLEQTIQHIQIIRECSGGFGFLRFSGIPQLQEQILWLTQQQCYNQGSNAKLLLNLICDKQKVFIIFKKSNIRIGPFEITIQDQHKAKTINKCLNNQEKSTRIRHKIHLIYLDKFRQGNQLIIQQLESNGSSKTKNFEEICNDIIDTYVFQRFFTKIAYRRNRTSGYLLDHLFGDILCSKLIKIITDQKKRESLNQVQILYRQSLKFQMGFILQSLEFEGTQSQMLLGQKDENQFYSKVIYYQEFIFNQLLHFFKDENARNKINEVEQIQQGLISYLQRARL